MHAVHAASGTGAGPAAPGDEEARRIIALLGEDALDAAIEAGLARFQPLPGLEDAENTTLVEARDRLLAAWAARERHRAREARLQRIAEERRQARDARSPAIPQATVRPALPPAAAAALARARARASGRQP